MPRIDITVPFSEKDYAKQLGARWDSKRKVWYIPDGIDVSVFKRWLPSDFDIGQSNPDINIRSSSYSIAKSASLCWKCKKPTNIYGFVLQDGYEILEENEEDDTKNTWYRYNEPTQVCYVTDLLPNVVERIKSFSRHYYADFSQTAQNVYWMNHCEHCGIKQGDYQIYCEPDGVFFSINNEYATSKIVLHEFSEPFGCNAEIISC